MRTGLTAFPDYRQINDYFLADFLAGGGYKFSNHTDWVQITSPVMFISSVVGPWSSSSNVMHADNAPGSGSFPVSAISMAAFIGVITENAATVDPPSTVTGVTCWYTCTTCPSHFISVRVVQLIIVPSWSGGGAGIPVLTILLIIEPVSVTQQFSSNGTSGV